jgi:hypothetical protein
MNNLWDTEEARGVRDRTVHQALNWIANEGVRGRARGEDASGERFTVK